jgi:hypothetical protein
VDNLNVKINTNNIEVIENKLMSKIILNIQVSVLGIMLIVLSGCTPSQAEKEQDAAFNLSSPPHKHFQQFNDNEFHPAEYFTCGEIGNPCKHYHNINQHFSGEK